MRDGGQRSLDHPSVNTGHQLIALGGGDELAGLNQLAVFIRHPQQHFKGGTPRHTANRRDDWLGVNFEAVLPQSNLQLSQPVDVTPLSRRDLVPRRIDVHAPASLLLGHVAGRVCGAQQVLQRASLPGHFYQADADADGEDPVLPDEAVVPDGVAYVVGDLARLVERAANQQHAEFVPAQPSDEVRVADLVADELGDFPEHIVASQMPAGVVHSLEPVQVHVAENRVHRVVVAAFQGLGQLPLELRAIDQPRQRVVGCLVGDPARQAAHLGDVMHDDHGARHRVASTDDR